MRRLFEIVAAAEDPKRLCIYEAGVGSRPSNLKGKISGAGSKARVARAYEFLASNYNPGDEIYVFGFSRGAFIARAFVGTLAYGGLYKPRGLESPTRLRELGAMQWEAVRDVSDIEAWGGTDEDSTKADIARVMKIDPNDMHGVPIKFLGLWDTVPAQAGVRFDHDARPLVTEFGSERPAPKGKRFKIQAYPNTERVAHAMSIDDKQELFVPVLMGSPRRADKTEVIEVWFPGAHSDIGGGYADSNALAGVTLNWMLRQLADERIVASNRMVKVSANPLGIRHDPRWSPAENAIGELFGVQSQSQRVVPPGALIHNSLLARTALRKETVSINGVESSSSAYRPLLTRNLWNTDGSLNQAVFRKEFRLHTDD